jgi:NADH-quinone oxidoreductase subunit D
MPEARIIGPEKPQAMDFMMKGHMLADTTAVLSAIDVVFGECDR